jgi:hypothetical protein
MIGKRFGVVVFLLAVAILTLNSGNVFAQTGGTGIVVGTVADPSTGTRIADIKDHKFKTMAECVSAYAQIEPLLSDYDHKLQSYVDLCNRAQLRDERRTFINILRREKPYGPEIWRNAAEIIQLVRQISSVMKKEASVIRDMSSFPIRIARCTEIFIAQA